MDFRSLLQSMTNISEAEGSRVHKGTYGTSHGKEDVRDQYGHKVGKIDKDAQGKEAAPKQGRGRPKKETNDGPKFDTSALSAAFGGSKKPSGKVGTVSKKHSLKEYIEDVASSTLVESQIEEAVSRKDFRMVADLIKNIEDPAKKAELAQHHAQIFKQQNPRFSPEKFYAAVGIDPSLSEEEITIKPMPGASQIVGADGETLGTADAATANTLKQAAAKGTLNLGAKQGMAEDELDEFIDVDSLNQLASHPMAGTLAAAGGAALGGAIGGAVKKAGDWYANRKEQQAQRNQQTRMAEGKKPDFLDVDKDEDKEESFKKAVKDKEAKKKVKESISFNEMSQDTQTEAQEMLAELQDDIENFVTTGHCSDKLEAFLKVHGHSKKKITDEGSIETHTQHGMDAKPSKFVAVDPKQAPTPWKVDPIQAATDRAGSFIKGLVAPKKTFEGTDMKDMQVESWENQLNGLLTEGITVSSSQGQQGAPDSVTVSATDADSQQLLQVLRQAGIGAFGGEQPASNYGAPMAPHGQSPEGHGTEPESAPEVAGDGDDMMALIKKMTGIQDSGTSGQEQPGTLEPAQGGDEGGQDYEDEEGSDEQGQEQEQGSEESEEEVTDEGNMFTGNLAKAREQGKEEADLDNDGDMEKVDEQGEPCNECGMTESQCGCPEEEEKVEEGYANEPDIEMMKLKALLSMGGDMHRVKQSQSVGNPTKVTMETKLMQQSTNLISDWKKLSGIK